MFTEEEEHLLLLRLVEGKVVLPPLNPRDFQRPAHQLIWRALVALVYQGLEISPRAVAARLPQAAGSADALEEGRRILGFSD